MDREPLQDMDGVVERAASIAARKINDTVQAQYASGTGPSGDPWAPLSPNTIAMGRSNPPLTNTGALAAGTTVLAEGTAIVATLPPVGQYHQTGTSRMPQRQILPEGGLSEQWETIIIDALDEEVRKCLGL